MGGRSLIEENTDILIRFFSWIELVAIVRVY